MSDSSLVLKIDGSENVVHFTATEDNVVIRSLQCFNAFTCASKISVMLKFKLQHVVAEILNGEVVCENVDVCSFEW